MYPDYLYKNGLLIEISESWFQRDGARGQSSMCGKTRCAP